MISRDQHPCFGLEERLMETVGLAGMKLKEAAVEKEDTTGCPDLEAEAADWRRKDLEEAG